MWVVRKLKKLISIPQVYTTTRNDYKEMKLVQYLRQWNPKLQQDEKWNLYLINPGTPLLCAHMDTRQTELSTNYNKLKWILKIKDWILKTGYCLWADDKCGVAIAMQIYEELWDNISLLFTVQEESGLHWARYFVENHKALLDSCLYCIIPDRMWGSDIIWYMNSYCSLEFQNKIADIVQFEWYKPAHGVCCDADQIRHVLNCVNMSCWYKYHHTDAEEINIDEFYNAYVAIYNILIELDEKMPIYKTPEYNQQKSINTTYRNKYTNHTTKNKNKHRPDSLWFGNFMGGENSDEEQYPDIPDDDYPPAIPLSKADREYEKEYLKKNKVGIKVDKNASTITFDNNAEMLLYSGNWEIISIPKGKYRFFKSTDALW